MLISAAISVRSPAPSTAVVHGSTAGQSSVRPCGAPPCAPRQAFFTALSKVRVRTPKSCASFFRHPSYSCGGSAARRDTTRANSSRSSPSSVSGFRALASSAARSIPSGNGSARSQPAGTSFGTGTIRTDAAPASCTSCATAAANRAPASSASGQIVTSRVATDDQSLFCGAFAPCSEVTATQSGHWWDAASAACSPSQISTGAMGLASNADRLKRG